MSGEMALDEIDVAAITRFRAKLLAAGKRDKTINKTMLYRGWPPSVRPP